VALNFQKERNQKNVNIGKQKFLVPLTI